MTAQRHYNQRLRRDPHPGHPPVHESSPGGGCPRSVIGGNDLWITATALAYDVALVTRNADDFQRIQGLVVLAY